MTCFKILDINNADENKQEHRKRRQLIANIQTKQKVVLVFIPKHHWSARRTPKRKESEEEIKIANRNGRAPRYQQKSVALVGLYFRVFTDYIKFQQAQEQYLPNQWWYLENTRKENHKVCI